jgi:hypothetical protein
MALPRTVYDERQHLSLEVTMISKSLYNAFIIILTLFNFSLADDNEGTQNISGEFPMVISGCISSVDLNSIGSIPEILIDELLPKKAPPNYIPKKKGLYTKDDWAAVIDATWGEGIPHVQKVDVWETVWGSIDAQFPCFRDLDPDIWDNIWNRYDEEISNGVSAGRFYAILCHATLALRETHTIVRDSEVSATEPLPGVPLLFSVSVGDCSHFGAALTPLPDKSLLVYKVIDDHPLGLNLGDIVLGYDGIAWKDLYPTLIEAELPLRGGIGSSASAYEHFWLGAAGANWHLFDEINIKKYA